MATFRLAQANVEQPDSPADTARTINIVAAHADVATFNEANEATTHKLIRHLPGWEAHTPGHGAAREDCIAWRTSAFLAVHRGASVVMHGGVVGGRRRGPSRAVTWVLLRERDTGAEFILAAHHAIARADTPGFRWRRPLRDAGFKTVARELARLLADYDAPLILTGDLNTVGRARFAGLGLREVRTPATFGRKRYDRILTTPGVRVRGVHALRTKSDHLALTARVSIKEKP